MKLSHSRTNPEGRGLKSVLQALAGRTAIEKAVFFPLLPTSCVAWGEFLALSVVSLLLQEAGQPQPRSPRGLPRSQIPTPTGQCRLAPAGRGPCVWTLWSKALGLPRPQGTPAPDSSGPRLHCGASQAVPGATSVASSQSSVRDPRGSPSSLSIPSTQPGTQLCQDNLKKGRCSGERWPRL